MSLRGRIATVAAVAVAVAIIVVSAAAYFAARAELRGEVDTALLRRAMAIETIEPLTQFGVAGLMGALWFWERTLSRKRERELSEAHDRVMRQQEHLQVIVGLVERNTEAIERFEATQKRLIDLLDEVHNQMRSKAA